MSPRTRSSRGGGGSRASPSRSPSRRSPSPSTRRRKSSPSKSPSTSARRKKKTSSDSPTAKGKGKGKGGAATGNNWVDGGLGDGTLMVPFLLVFAPMFVQVLGYLTSADCAVDPTAGLTGLLSHCASGLGGCASSVVDVVRASYAAPTWEAAKFLLGFSGLALALDVGLPGKIEYGPETLTGHVPDYRNNSLLHCATFTFCFYAFSDISGFGIELYSFGVIYDVFPAMISILNIFGMALALFLQYKGLNFPSTADSGTTGSFFKDFTWGTELYPRVYDVDIKRFVNCRFSMTFWMLAGLSYTHRSYQLHGELDYGLLLGAVSQFLYLVKFFEWEIGYMRSIDIIVDRAGWEIQWGCLVWVPSVYTLHSRFLVQHPSNLSMPVATTIFLIGFAGVLLNYWADVQRQKFRESGGKMLVWGSPPVFVNASYTIYNKDGTKTTRSSLLLASGFWGIARHFHYVFELTAAWSWGILSNPAKNGALVLFYPFFLTILLAERAKRDERKCQNKYGKHYDTYSKKVPYLIIPGVY